MLDFSLHRGTNEPVVEWEFPPSFDVDVGWELSVSWRGGSLRATSEEGGLVIDLGERVVRWAYTVAQTRLLPLGRVATYELERRTDTGQRVYATGHITVTGGLNRD
ncbi:MAG TPA: hypothetical protein VHL98_11190 [Microvirga sp.]|nr:hypothetical protein [Microvirga sp.]